MRKGLMVLVFAGLVTPVAADTPLTRAQIEAFMRSARVVSQRETPIGVTRPLRLTMSDGTLTHDAAFQAINEYKSVYRPAQGKTELNFVDSWKYNVAAARLAGLLGLEEMMPVTIQYRHAGKDGALAWWMDSQMNEGERLKKRLQPPDQEAWNNDMYRQRVFMELVQDTDRNLTNVLISPSWRLIMIDFTRAFRLGESIRGEELSRGDRALLARLDGLSTEMVATATKGFLTGPEVKAVMKRRDLLVVHYRQLVQKLGEAAVLY